MEIFTGRKLRTEDGYTFYEMADGRLVDSTDADSRDLEFTNMRELIDEYGWSFRWIVRASEIPNYALLWYRADTFDSWSYMPCGVEYDEETGQATITQLDGFYDLAVLADEGEPLYSELVWQAMKMYEKTITAPQNVAGPKVWTHLQLTREHYGTCQAYGVEGETPWLDR